MKTDELRTRVRAAVAGAGETKQRIAALVAEGAEQFHREAQGLIGLTQAVIEAAMGAARDLVPDRAERASRDVIEGLGDGLARAANATKFTLEEAQGAGTRFAQDELQKLASDLHTLGEMFVDTIVRAGVGAAAASSTQGKALREHAARTLESARPALAAALDAARSQMQAMASEAARAGLSASRRVAGDLFGRVGRVLSRVGETLEGKPPSP